MAFCALCVSFAISASPSLSLSQCEKSNLGQHVVAEALHVGNHGIGGVAAKAKIDRDDAEFA
jgi:hypothetical protein